MDVIAIIALIISLILFVTIIVVIYYFFYVLQLLRSEGFSYNVITSHVSRTLPQDVINLSTNTLYIIAEKSTITRKEVFTLFINVPVISHQIPGRTLIITNFSHAIVNIVAQSGTIINFTKPILKNKESAIFITGTLNELYQIL